MYRAALETFYDSLCIQGLKHDIGNVLSSGFKRGGIGKNGLQWEHEDYGTRRFHGCYDWNAGHGREWYCANPIEVPNLTDFILSILTLASNTLEPSEIASQEAEACRGISTQSDACLESSPGKILHQICSFFPTSPVFTLRLSSNALASHLILTNNSGSNG
ncbi:hypothetical protein EAF04_002172 [Stromatinia cepivora]|nr:hypothetical protein EAF04_002172 [Stromatinia cepivora]